MIRFLRGTNGTGPYFEGWYLKHQTPQGQALALISAVHTDSGGRHTASLQVISNDEAWRLEYPGAQLQFSRKPFQIQIGQSGFSSQGTAIGNLAVQMIAAGEFSPLQEAKTLIKASFDIKEVTPQ